jgi:methylated-DNA-[protein]-cysteine S-methyltransferase
MDRKNIYSIHFKTSIGKLALTATPKGLHSLDFQKSDEQTGLPSRSAPPQTSQLLREAAKRIRRFLQGRPVEFADLPVDWQGLNAFERKILRELCKLPRGRTASYQDLARRGGRPKAARYVGRIMSENRLPFIIPCHRVLPKNGGWGGFSKGPALKKRLLKLESAQVDKNSGNDRAR